MLRPVLCQAGHELLEVPDAERALWQLGRVPVDAVLFDERLPGLQGPDLCREVRRRSSVPTIALTGGGSHHAGATSAAGADHRLERPLAGCGAQGWTSVVLQTVSRAIEARVAPEVTVQTGHGPSTTTLRVGGELDLASAPQLLSVASELLPADHHVPVVVDLDHLEFLDSAGAEAIVALLALGRSRGLAVGVRATAPLIALVLDVMRVDADAVVDPSGQASSSNR